MKPSSSLVVETETQATATAHRRGWAWPAAGMGRFGACVALTLSMLLITGCRSVPKDITMVPRMEQPPAGKALVNFHRPSSYDWRERFAIFDINGTMLMDLPANYEFQYVCDPGKHHFIAWFDHVSVVEADLAADKVYDIMVDVGMGWVRANIRMTPLLKGDERRARLAEFEKKEQVMTQNRTAHITDYEQKRQPKIAEIKKDFLEGDKKDRVIRLGKDDCR